MKSFVYDDEIISLDVVGNKDYEVVHDRPSGYDHPK